MKVTQLAYRLKLTPKQISQIAYDLNIKKQHNFYGEESFSLKDTKKIIAIFKQAKQMKVSPFFLLSTLAYRQKTKQTEPNFHTF